MRFGSAAGFVGYGVGDPSGNSFLYKMEQPAIPNPHLPDIMIEVPAEVALPEDGKN
jgi:hypothetical protein